MVYRWGEVEGMDEGAGGNVSKIGWRKGGDGKYTVGRIGGATTFATGGTERMVVQRGERWLSSAFINYVEKNGRFIRSIKVVVKKERPRE